MPEPKIAVCFFGITRSLSYTVRSIERCILRPAQRQGETRLFAHFFDQRDISNPRSREAGRLRRDEHKLLPLDWLELEEPDTFLPARGFDAVAAFGDAHDDDFRSLRNLFHQLHSLDRVTRQAMTWAPDIVVFARPDLAYHQSFAPVLKAALRRSDPAAFLPRWQQWKGGVNDRFAVCTADAAPVYGSRIDSMIEFCTTQSSMLHAEQLLKYRLDRAGVSIIPIPHRASRIRFDGTMNFEDFSPPNPTFLQRKLALLQWHVFRRMPRRPVSGV